MRRPDSTKLLFVFGTRPEAIKLAPVILACRSEPRFEVVVCLTGQHRDLVAEVLELFGVRADFDLAIQHPGQTLTAITTSVLSSLAPLLGEVGPDWVVVQGDTTSTFAAGLAAFYAGIPVAHVEAGLRTGNPLLPFPEEMNRLLTGRLAALHFAPTAQARENLLREGTPPESIHVTGNTGIDALLAVAARIRDDEALRVTLAERFSFLDPSRRLVLATAHRRESFGAGLASICRGVEMIVDGRNDVEILVPTHPNPNVRGPIEEALVGVAGVRLVAPVDYVSMVYLMTRAHFVLTDSGGLQEEAPALGCPVLVMRESTDRPELVTAGSGMVVGTDPERIASAGRSLLDDRDLHSSMSRPAMPFGDGRASGRIVAAMLARMTS